MLYQPVWRDGKELGAGKRDAAGRFAAIAEYLGAARGFTCLDLGAYGGYFSARLADQFGAKCTAVDDSPYLIEAPGVKVINQRLTPAEIRNLGQFDVVLCLSVLHHLKSWRATLNALLDAAPVVFTETAHPDENLPKAANHKASAQIHAALEQAGAIVLTQTPGYDERFERPLWVVDRTNPIVALPAGPLDEYRGE